MSEARIIGQALHAMLGELLAGRAAPATLPDLLVWVAQHPAVSDLSTNRRGQVRHRISVALSCYLRHFALEEPWVLLGADVGASRLPQLDLVWELPNGVVVSDEIKSGDLLVGGHAGLMRQVRRQLDGGREVYGQDFFGVRTVLLRAPGDSRVYSTDGQAHPLLVCDDLAREFQEGGRAS